MAAADSGRRVHRDRRIDVGREALGQWSVGSGQGHSPPTTALTLESVGKLHAKLRDLRCDHGGTVWLVRIVRKVFLMIFLGGPELVVRSIIGIYRFFLLAD